jgi:tetratricopeptide (TPR) repeat protein
VLYNTFQRDNAHVKFLLARALLYANRPNEAAQHAEQLLNPRYNFDLSLKKTEDDQVATEQKTQALLAEAYYDMGRFSEAMEQYRRAHDRNLKAAERPFYSLGIVDCLIGMNRIDEAVNRLKRIKWEFEEFFKEDSVVLKDKPGFSKEDWISLVDQRINQLQDSAA